MSRPAVESAEHPSVSEHSSPAVAPVRIRKARLVDLDRLYELEVATFDTDRLSRRSLRRWISADNGILLLAEQDGQLLGYCLAFLHKGTRLARLYSLAVSTAARGQGVARRLMKRLEKKAAKRGKLFMRLEVAQDNKAAIGLYAALGYIAFGTYHDYYEDHQDALRMQKRIRYVEEDLKYRKVPWYQQTTDFTCGPASLMMAMSALDKSVSFSQELELDIWREATSIFMTAGHGGCHPIGLALAAHRRGFHPTVVVNSQEPLFVDGVRAQDKKDILTVVHNHFVELASKKKIPISYANISQVEIEQYLEEGALLLMLISTYQMDGKKSPHWVIVTAIDDECLYVHDPDPTEDFQTPVDCQYMPIHRNDFGKMSVFGKSQLRTAVIIRK